MERRTFMGILGGSGLMAGAATERRTRFYVLERFYLRQGSQVPRIHEFLSQAMLPALEKMHHGPKIFLESLVAPHMPQVVAIYGFGSLEEMWSLHTRLNADADLRKAMESWERGAEPAVEQQENILLEAAEYSPEITAGEPGKSPRVFELRTYHSPTWQQLQALHERFAGPEIKIFHRVGVNPLLYTSTVIGPQMPNLTYLIPFADLAAREKAWNAFAADPEWIKVRKESTDQHGQISSVIQISLYKATAYSPVR